MGVAAFTLILAFSVLVPLIAIWAINTLFKADIQYTLQNWIAMLLLLILFQAPSSEGNNR